MTTEPIGAWQREHRDCQTYDAERRAALIRQIADASAAARKQAHRSLDTAIRTSATGTDVQAHSANLHAAWQLRCVLATLGHDGPCDCPVAADRA